MRNDELAFKIVNELVRRKRRKILESRERPQDINFEEIEKYYDEINLALEHNQEIRAEIVDKLKELYRSGFDLNKLYSDADIVEDLTLLRMCEL